MSYRYGSDDAFEALIAKTVALINASSDIASAAQNSADKALKDAAAAQSTANQALSRTLTQISGTLTVAKGGTGATSAAAARTNLGITPANIGAAPDKHDHAASDITSGTIPISRGGTGATTTQSALSNLGALSKIAAYYPSSAEDFDLDTAIDGIMLIAQQFSKNCPLTSPFIFIIQLFYSTITSTSPRVQIALPYNGTGMAIRTFYQSVWSEWEVVGTSGNSKSLATSTLNGLMSAADKIKLDGIAKNANAYVHPSTHDHSMISGLTANRALVSDSKGTISESSVTSTELGYLDGVTSAIQTQLNGKAASRHNHSASNITSGTLPVARGGTGATDAETARENLGITLANLGAAAASHNHSASNITSGTLAVSRGGTGLTKSPSMLVNLGSTTAGSVFTTSPRPGITGILPIANGGTGATDAETAREKLGITPANIGAAASSHNHSASNITSGTLAVSRGGTGATSTAAARTSLGAAEGYTKSASVSATGWYRIATSASGISNNIGIFSIRAAVSGKHSNILLAAGISYGDNPDVVQLLVSNFASAAITKARIVYHNTYDGNYAYLELYFNVTAATTVDVNMALCDGWTLVAPNTAGRIPSGYTSKEFVLANGTIGGYTASRALVTNSSGTITESAVTSTELGYLDGVTSAIQTQLNGKASSSHNHSASNITSGTLPVSRGGTGLTASPSLLVNLGSTSAASVMAASPRPGVTGTLPISRGGTGATSASAALTALGAAKRAYYTCTVSTSSWKANSSGGYSKKITVSGILSTDVPVVGVVLSSTVSTAKLQGAAFACINRITTASNSITCYAYNNAPTTSITLQLLVVR